MNQRISLFLLISCLLLFLSNYYWIDWEAYANNRISENLSELILDQRSDLEAWAAGENLDGEFRKRTLCKGRLEAWSDDRPFDYELSIDSIGVLENDHGVFLYQSFVKGDCRYLSGYPLYQKYVISNEYLKSERSSKLTHHIKGISEQGAYHYHELIYYDIKPRPSPEIDAIIGLILIAVFFLEFLKASKKSFPTFLYATAALIMLRGVSLWVNALDALFRFSLFNPLHFTSSFFNPTLGDLCINCMLVFILCVRIIKYMDRFNFRYGWLVLTVLMCSLSLLVFHLPWSILNNSQLSFDIGLSIHFDYLRVAAYGVLLAIGTSYFCLLYYFQKFLVQTSSLRKATIFSFGIGLLLVVINPLLALTVVLTASTLLISNVVSWNQSLGDFNYRNLLYIWLVSMNLALLFSLFVYKHGERAELFAKKKFANYLLLKRDVLGEYLLSQQLEKITNDEGLIQIASEGTKEDLESKLLEEFSGPYFNKYAIEIVFQDYQRLKVNTPFTRERGLLTAANVSDYENIHFIDQGADFKYIAKLNVGGLVSLIIFKVKKRVPTTVYPALLTDSKFITASLDFDYAIFSDNEILFHKSRFGQGEWPQTEDFENEDLFEEGIEKNEKHYYGIKTNDGRIILIISQKHPFRARLANFCFFFLLLLFAFSFTCAVASLRRENQSGFTFTSKIQLYLSLALIAPLLTTGFALLSTLNTSYKEEINRSYLKQSLYISELLSERLDSGEIDIFNKKALNEIGDYIQSDISFYNPSGYLISTSQPDIFKLGLQSNLINPVVYDELIARENQTMIANESIGTLGYKVCYAVVNTADNELLGFIAMPFFDSKNHLRRQQIDVFDNLIIVFGFIFIIAILVGNLVINNLLQPLRMVAGKIRQITLQEVNQPINYQSSDEIGSLVKDYNQMLVKLENSKQALAKSQKETAWKEIAKQVAHEIKNPLTPMQLKIQQLLRKFEKETKEYEALTSLLTQVDTLSQIAQSFSAFAEMPAPDNQLFYWNELVEEVTRLYRSESVKIEIACKRVAIDADKDIFRRILNNIVLNAIQSVEDQPAEISITLNKKSDKALLLVMDNGKGIPEKLKDKIFLNYFSTKATGSGIGLALAKKGIENAGGNIWFESKEGEGTTFFISMPIAAE